FPSPTLFRSVLSNVLQVADGRLEPVLHGTEVGAGAVYRGDGVVEGLDGQLGVFDGEDIQTIDGMVSYRCCNSGYIILNTDSCICIFSIRKPQSADPF